MDAHNFPSDWEYYEWLEGRKESWDESYDEYGDGEDGGEDE